MSAAEKLRALDDLDAFDLANAIRCALPQIIAVVEAAERREDFAAPGVARLVVELDEVLTVDGKPPK